MSLWSKSSLYISKTIFFPLRIPKAVLKWHKQIRQVFSGFYFSLSLSLSLSPSLPLSHGLSEFDVYFSRRGAPPLRPRQSPEMGLMSSPLPEENAKSRIIGPIDEKEKDKTP